MSQHPFLTILYKIHVFGLMSQHLRISGSSARSMCPIHVLASTNMDPLQDPRLRTHVSGSMCPIHVLASTTIDPLQDPCRGILNCEAVTASISQDLCLSIPILGPYRQDPCSWSPLPRHESLLACVFTLKTELSAA